MGRLQHIVSVFKPATLYPAPTSILRIPHGFYIYCQAFFTSPIIDFSVVSVPIRNNFVPERSGTSLCGKKPLP